MIFAGMLTSAENIPYIRNTETSWGQPEAGMWAGSLPQSLGA